MGFLDAVLALGKMDKDADTQGTGCGDIVDFLSTPLAEGQKGMVIRVWLKVADLAAEVLDIRGMADLDLVEYWADTGTDLEKRIRYLYREPPGTNTPWAYTPLMKLGKGVKEGAQELLGSGWKEDRNARFNKLYRRILADYELSGYFTAGSVDRIMADLEKQAESIAGFWTDRKLSHLLLFGLEQEGRFLYPGEVPLFVRYFREKFSRGNATGQPMCCALCGIDDERGTPLSQVFKFATFDKESFLPGIKDGTGVKEKVFPLCRQCFSWLTRGRDGMDRLFLDRKTIPGVNIYILPELLLGERYLSRISQQSRDFLKSGIRWEETLFNTLADQDEALVFHFVFWEQNQAQERIHLMVEDVPPSRLNHLTRLWCETLALSVKETKPEEVMHRETLDYALRTVRQVLLSLAGKGEQDKKYLLERVVGLVGKILGGEKIPIHPVKSLCVSRFPGLFSDQEWLKMGRFRGKQMEWTIDFLARVDRARNGEERRANI